MFLFEVLSPQWASKLVEQVYIEDSVEQQFLKYALLAKAASYYIMGRIGINEIDVIDLQESYISLILMALPGYLDKFRLIIHTPGPWGHPSYPGEYVQKEFGVPAGKHIVSTIYALEKLGKAIVVSMKHREIISKVFPEFSEVFRPITNGIYLRR